MKNIGISIFLKTEDYSIWANGIRQLIFFFAQALMNLGKFNVYIVNINPQIKITSKLSWDLNKFKTVQFEDIKKDLDLLFILGSEITPNEGYAMQASGCKIVYFNGGNRYVLEMEEMLFKGGKIKAADHGFISEIWMLPQMLNSCYYYLDTTYRVPVKPVPFLWSSLFLDASCQKLPNLARYTPGRTSKRLGCFEPNLDVVKFCMYDVLIAERAYRLKPQLIESMYITNALALKDVPLFASLMTKLDLVRDGKASFEARFPMPEFLSRHIDVVIAHQWENALNYAYLDALYLNYPLVHNAHLIKDAGYFFEGFDAQQGAEQLLQAIETHDSNINEYEERSAKTLRRYSISNEENLAVYEGLIDRLLRQS